MPSAAKAYKGMGMEGWVARWYAANTGKDLSDFTAQARKLAASLAPAAAVLEITPGPGYFAIELARAGNFRITGLDISATFVDLARKNAADARVEVDFRRGDAAHMPFDDNTFNAICLPRRVQEFFPAGDSAPGNVPRTQTGRQRANHQSPQRRIERGYRRRGRHSQAEPAGTLFSPNRHRT